MWKLVVSSSTIVVNCYGHQRLPGAISLVLLSACTTLCTQIYRLMASMKYDLPLLDRDTRFTLWQVKMRALLAHADYDVALDSFGKNRIKDWTAEEKRIDCKALSQI